MSQPIFLIGPQRSGTSILARTICRAEDVARRHFNPCPRWDIPAMAELGGGLRVTPWLDRMDRWVAEQSERYALVRFALPWAVESFAWPRLARGRPKARFVFISRGVYDTFSSWATLDYLSSFATDLRLASYEDWHRVIVHMALNQDVPCVQYDRLVKKGASTLAHVWDSLDLEPPTLPDDWFHKPKHWSGDPT